MAKTVRRAPLGPIVRIDRCVVEPGAKGTYRVVIEGFNLHGSISPPRVTVGGVPLVNIQFQADGQKLTGTLAAKPRSKKVVVDYGFARATAAM